MKYLIVSKYDLWLYATIVLGFVFKKLSHIFLKKQSLNTHHKKKLGNRSKM